MTPAERLVGPRSKVQRADFHVYNLEAEVSAFLSAKPYEILSKVNPQTRQLVYYVSRVDAPPRQFSLFIGDALFGLRSALDHLAVQFLLANVPGAAPFNVYFPIYSDAAEYGKKAPKRMNGMSQKAIDFINAAKPYKGGNDDLWLLNKLNNIDKHRLLLTTVINIESINRGRLLFDEMFGALGMKGPAFNIFFPVDRSDALKAGDEILIAAPDSKPNPNFDIRCLVAINEPGIAPLKPITGLLRQLSGAVTNLLDAAEPILA